MTHDLGARYGGTWFNNATGHYEVAVSSPDGGIDAVTPRAEIDALTASAQPYLESAGIQSETGFVSVRYSQAELEAAQEVLDGRLKSLVEPGQVTTGLNSEGNAIVVRQSTALSPNKVEEIATYAKEASVAVEVVPTAPAALEIHADACANPKQSGTQFLFCTRSLRGGVSVVDRGNIPGNVENICSLGFIVHNSAGAEYVTVAGHCDAQESKPVWDSASTDWTSTNEDWKEIGREDGNYMGEEGDFAWIKMNESASPWYPVSDPSDVASLDPSGYWGVNENQFLENISWSAEGDYMCRTGGSSDTACGQVLHTNEWAFYENRWIGRLTTANFCTKVGDSGGTVWGNHSGFGMAAAATACGAGQLSYYTEAIRDAYLMGLSFYVPPYNETY